EPASPGVEFVKHAVITNSQSVLGTSGQPMVRIGAEPHAHFVYLSVHVFADCSGKLVKGLAATVRPDLKRSAHCRSRLAGAKLARRDFRAGLVKFGFNL